MQKYSTVKFHLSFAVGDEISLKIKIYGIHCPYRYNYPQQAYDSLQDTFDETCETYLEQNPGMEIAEAERKTFDELKSNYRQALISNYHDLVQMGNILKKTQSTNKQWLQLNDYDLKKITI